MPTNKIFTVRERDFIKRLYHYFKQEKSSGNANWHESSREHTATVLQISPASVARVCSDHKRNNTEEKSNVPIVIGRPRKFNENVLMKIKLIVNEKNQEGIPVTIKLVKQELLHRYEIDLSASTIRKNMKDHGFRYSKGNISHINSTHPSIIELRNSYIEYKLTNRYRKILPNIPEVYLDESYANLHHSHNQTWHCGGSIFRRFGSGSRLIIIGAGILYRKREKLCAEWVDNSLKIWHQRSKTQNVTTNRSKKRNRNEYEEIDPNLDDYHSAMNNEYFIRWFRNICDVLQSKYGKCMIIMDNARYHKCIDHNFPKQAWKKQKIMEWLNNENIGCDDSMKKNEMMDLVHENFQKPQPECINIASEYGHIVSFLPPYHPQLNPIEMIWGVAKNKIAMNFYQDIHELQKDLEFILKNDVTEKTWIGAYKRTQETENNFQKCIN